MSGHSKWSTIKHKKAAEDQKRGAVFTKIAKKIHIAVKNGGSGDPNMNPILRTILDEARYANMPSDNVKRAIEKALGSGGNSDMSQEVVYEGYGPNGVGFMVTCVTDNRNRTGGEIKLVFDKFGGSLAGPGSVSYMLNINPVPRVAVTDEVKKTCEKMVECFNDNEDVVDVWNNLAE